MKYFFYGTLMDADVLAAVLGRRLPPSSLIPARLDGYRRVFREQATYPILIEDASSTIDGRLVSSLSRRDAERLSMFEGPDYHQAAVLVRHSCARVCQATAFLPVPGVRAAATEWRLETWRLRFKRGFLDQIRATGLAAEACGISPRQGCSQA